MLAASFFVTDFGFGNDKNLGGFIGEAAVESLALLRADSPGVPGGNGKW